MNYQQRRVIRKRMMHRAVIRIHMKNAAASIQNFIPEMIAGIGFAGLFCVITLLGAILE